FSYWMSFARKMANLGFYLTALSSTLFIAMTVFFVKDKMGSYKNLLLVLPILFALFEYLVDPFFHSYNGSFAFFRLSSFENYSAKFNMCALAVYVALYGSTVSVLALQFVYRYCAVFKAHFFVKQQFQVSCFSPRYIRMFFEGPQFIFSIIYIAFFCFLFFINDLIFNQLDEYSTEYLKNDMMESYGVNVTNVAAFVLVAYDESGHIRIKNTVGLLAMSLELNIQYIIIIYCAVVMSSKMQQKLSTLSEKLQKVHKQFYYVLIFQITTPTLTLFFPVFALFFVPYLNIEISFPTGTILSTFALYPALDLLIMVYIASYYNQALK
ncbi:LOW QUALITY PROTEIN: Protein CBG01408, partial [Caenorhabditis briggsae]